MKRGKKERTVAAITRNWGGSSAPIDSVEEGRSPVLGTGQTWAVEGEGVVGVLRSGGELAGRKRKEGASGWGVAGRRQDVWPMGAVGVGRHMVREPRGADRWTPQ
jgi:hypothetical protein